MSEPQTEAGQKMLTDWLAGRDLLNYVPEQGGMVSDQIARIEAQARADAVREAAEKVRALPLRQGGTGIQTYRAEVLAILEPQSEEHPR